MKEVLALQGVNVGPGGWRAGIGIRSAGGCTGVSETPALLRILTCFARNLSAFVRLAIKLDTLEYRDDQSDYAQCRRRCPFDARQRDWAPAR